MYSKPELVRYGTFRELTLVGFGSDGDGGVLGSGFLDGCDLFCGGGDDRS